MAAVATKGRKAMSPHERFASFESRAVEIRAAIEAADRREAELLDQLAEARVEGEEPEGVLRELAGLRGARETDRAALRLIEDQKIPTARRAVEASDLEAALREARALVPVVEDRVRKVVEAVAVLESEVEPMREDSATLARLAGRFGMRAEAGHDGKLGSATPVRWALETLMGALWPTEHSRPLPQIRRIDTRDMYARMTGNLLGSMEKRVAEAWSAAGVNTKDDDDANE